MTPPIMSLSAPPLLGVAGAWGLDEVDLHRRFDQLHQLAYTLGGLHSSNAALDELTKLIFVGLWVDRCAAMNLPYGEFSSIFTDPLDDQELVILTREAFKAARTDERMKYTDVAGYAKAFWDGDEPLRIQQPEILRAMLTEVWNILTTSRRNRSHIDPLGTAFDALLSGRYDHAGGLGTYLTPSSVARSMADIALHLFSANANDAHSLTVADPYCGTGRFLVAAKDAAAENYPTAHPSLVGADQSSSALTKAGINLMLYGEETPTLSLVADSATSHDLHLLDNRVDIVLTNPPFGEGKYSSSEGIDLTAQRFSGVAHRSKIDPAIAGLAKSLELLRPGGVAAVILPDGLIDGRILSEGLQASRFTSHFAVRGLLSLPTATFALSGTVAKTSALFIQRTPSARGVYFMRADHVGYIKQAGKAVADPQGSDLPEITRQMKQIDVTANTSHPTVLHEAPLVASLPESELRSLDVSRLDPKAAAARSRVHASGGMRLGEFVAGHRRRRAKTHSPFVSVLHIDELGAIAWHESCSYAPTTPGQSASGGDILVSLLNPAKFRAGVVREDLDEVECSAEFGVFTPNIDPYAVLGLLNMEDVKVQLRPLGRGTSSSRRRISIDDVLDLQVPALSPDALDLLGQSVRTRIQAVEMSRIELKEIYSGTPSNTSSSMTPAVASSKKSGQ